MSASDWQDSAEKTNMDCKFVELCEHKAVNPEYAQWHDHLLDASLSYA